MLLSMCIMVETPFCLEKTLAEKQLIRGVHGSVVMMCIMQ